MMINNLDENSVWLSWSSGKDSAWCFYKLLQSKKYGISTIFSTVNEKYQRVAMHGTRLSILRAQARQLGVKLELIYIPDSCSNAIYESTMSKFINYAKNKSINTIAFGDLFLQDIRQYRENSLLNQNIKPIFPLWKLDTHQLAYEMIENGLKAIVTCVDTKQIPSSFLGQEFNIKFLESLPASVDPCGENGEFHTCVYDLPCFKEALKIEIGHKKIVGQFHFIDLLFR